MTKYNTNLAAEFHVLSVLHRLGAEATLTLGNKKSVDIVVVRSNHQLMTVDVKGLAGKTAWRIDNVDNVQSKENHYLVFVSFLDRIADPTVVPECYVVPFLKVKSLTYFALRGWKDVNLSTLRGKGKKYLNDWQALL